MKVAIVFRVANPRLRKFGRLSIMRDNWQNPLVMTPEIADQIANSLREIGVKSIRYVPELVAEQMNTRYFRRLLTHY